MKALISLNLLHKKSHQKGGFVPRTGIEPALPCDNQILSLARLPIPPSRLFSGQSLKSCTLISVGLQIYQFFP